MTLKKDRKIFRLDIYFMDDGTISRGDLVRSIRILDDITGVIDDDVGNDVTNSRPFTDGTKLPPPVKQAIRDFIGN